MKMLQNYHPWLLVIVIAVSIFSLYVQSVPTTTTASCGLWTTWTYYCNDSCGSCGYQYRNRTCGTTSLGCPCNGQASILDTSVPCNFNICKYPRSPCCTGYNVTNVDGTHQCVASAAIGRK